MYSNNVVWHNCTKHLNNQDGLLMKKIKFIREKLKASHVKKKKDHAYLRPLDEVH